MKNQINTGDQNAQQVAQNPVSQPVQAPEKQKINYWMVSTAVLVLLVMGFMGGYVFKSKPEKGQTYAPQPTKPNTTEQPTATKPAKIPQVNGADLKDIRYTLPQGWEAKLGDSLFISPVNGGGFLSIRVYNYPDNIGRREYYCQVSKVCIEGTTYFNEMSLGNISGYIANALDNSGGGAEYLGAKGNKFYIISSYNPPSPNEFEKNYRDVLNSLVF